MLTVNNKEVIMAANPDEVRNCIWLLKQDHPIKVMGAAAELDDNPNLSTAVAKQISKDGGDPNLFLHMFFEGSKAHVRNAAIRELKDNSVSAAKFIQHVNELAITHWETSPMIVDLRRIIAENNIDPDTRCGIKKVQFLA